ncbi:glycoside hydrolase family 3 protein [Catenulispora yoronensis]
MKPHDGPGRPRTARRRLVRVGVAAVVAVASVDAAAATGAAGFSGPAYLNRSAPISARVNDLLGRMTLAEKAGQMDQQLVDNVTAAAGGACGAAGFNLPSPACLQAALVDQNVGSLLAGGTDNPVDTTGNGGSGNTAQDWANEYNAIQQFAVSHSRLHIPVVFGVDAVHGFGHPYQAPLFPQSIGMGATWDTTAARDGGAMTASALRATGWTWDFAPVQDVARDNRWGRTYETWGEEPALTSALGAANVAGMQAPAGGLNVGATVKHFAGYSQSVNGHDRNEALLPMNYLQTTILPSYAGAIDAGADAVMVDSGSINGVPATGSHTLLTDILRGQLGFKGVVISDYQDVQALQTAYHIAPDLPGAIAAAVNAGLDMSMEVGGADQWQAAVLQDVATGKIKMSRIDDAVRRILTMKFKLGLFDQPCVADPTKACVDPGAANAAATRGGTRPSRPRRSRSPCCATRTARSRWRPAPAWS